MYCANKRTAVTDAADVRIDPPLADAYDAIPEGSVEFTNLGPGSCFIGPQGVTASGSNVGRELPAGERVSIDYKTEPKMYARCATGQTASVHAFQTEG